MSLNLIEHFRSTAGNIIRIKKNDIGEPLFCAKDLCEALGIVSYRNKVAKLDIDEKVLYKMHTMGGVQNMQLVTEPGMYKIILTCRDATTKNTPAHAFCRWVTHEVLPSIRKDREYKMKSQLLLSYREEKGRRLWILFRDMNVWSYNVRRKYFGNGLRSYKRILLQR